MARRWRTAVVALAAGAALFAPAPDAGAAPQTVTRLSGNDRFETAVAISQATHPGGAEAVVIATGENYPDALAGGPFAVADPPAPILLVNQSAIPQSTAAELQRLSPTGIVVLGGPAAVSQGVVDDLAAYASENVVRREGIDRYATAAAISQVTFSPGVPLAYVATGTDFADAVAGSAAGAATGGPVLLVEPGRVPGATAAELQRLQPGAIAILGGTTAVSPQVAAALDPYTAGTVTRISGPDRYATAVALSAFTYPGGATTAYVATGANFPDALAGGPAAGQAPGPLLLVPGSCVPSAVLDELDRLGATDMVLLGGPTVVSAAVAELMPCTPAGQLVLGPLGLGLVDFGTAASSAVDQLTGALGPPDATQTVSECPSGAIDQVVVWGDLSVGLGPTDAGQQFVGYGYGGADATGDPLLTTDTGVGVGTTVEELLEAYPEGVNIEDTDVFGPRYDVVDPPGGPDWPGLNGALTGTDGGDAIVTVSAGAFCGE